MRKYICCLLNLLCFCSFSFAQSLFLNPSIENKLILHSESMDKLIFSNSIGSIDTIKKIQIDSSTYFSEIQQNGYRFSNHIGEPKLPIKVQLIEIPQGATIKIHILSQEYQDISLDKVRHPFPIIPVQNPINKGFKQAPPFALNEKIYKSKKFLPKTLVSVQELGEMRASRLAHLIISPFCYNPQKNILRVYTQLSFEIIFEGAQFEKTIEKKQIYQTERSYNVGNWCLNQLPSSTLSTHKFPSQALKYVIVADSIFKNDLQEFIAWKRQQGYAIIEAYTSNPLVGKSCESIHAYLKKLYTEATPYQAPPSYILLVGDIAQIPAFPSKLPDMPSCYTKDHISDLYYAEYTGDYLPDVFYGRFSANTVEELRPQIEKTLAMEQLRIPSQNFMDTSMLIAGYDKTYGNSHLNTQINYIEQYYINAQEGICPFKFLFPESKNQKEKILQVFSKGVNLISYTGHGSETSWANIELTTQDIDALSNHNKYPFVLGNCCLTGKFNFGECFAEALLRADKKGAVAYIGASNNSFFDEDLYWTIGFGDIETSTLTYENTSLGMFDKLFHTHGEPPDKWALSLGEILTQGNLSVMESNSILQNYYWEIYHIFGDPSYMPYKKKPSLPKAIYSKHIVKGETLFNVQTEAFAYVALSDSNTLYGACTADANGIAEIKISTLPQKDSIQLHIQAQFCSPYTASIRLEQPSQAYVIVDSIQILNSQGSMATSGEYNKSYTLQIQLHNLGRTDAQFCTCKLRSPHPSVHIVDTAFLNVPIVPNGT
ncbi:MAG: C25 family cysteine peptidase, partial [Bacteroidales bacterium]